MRTGPRSLRSRLTLLVAAAVAAAIAVCAGACWFLVRSELLDQVDRSLRSPKGPQGVEWIERYCSGAEPDRPPPRLALLQLVDAAGRTCAVGTEVEVVPGDRELARAPRGTEAFRDGTTSEGDEVRVLVQSVGGGLVLMESRPLEEFRSTLTALAGILAGVAALGVVGAATAGRLIARTALRPVERLTGAVEHIARTEDLGTRIPVEGTDELARLGASFNAMTAALAGARERQRRLIADAGHELRTPLTSLRTNIDLLLRSEDSGRPLEPAPKCRLLAGLKAQFEEMSTLVGALLQLSRGDSEHAPRVEVAFHEVVGAAVERARLRARDLPIETDLGPWYVHADPAALERAVVNLLDNAVKFSADPGDGPEGARPGSGDGPGDGGPGGPGGPAGSGGGRGPVVVRLRDGELTVRDHGPGIARAELPYVFDRFWRSPSARSMPGSGLGLAIVAQAVREAGGEVALENADDGGAVARLRLPGSLAAGGGD
ncbi:HAMP domain-containing sensor histidine kinase [Planomonospora parontospora]|uniref:HAMP domain-containing sensor histidine kinase n=1 Tax=Planomonospora parontospora TaxID=58119 RepID=UPI00167042FD|nr:HAMP domain-containing sensor histidine kinase [Planomonospora parontospora]GGL12877.1 two-component sensor histidine kinase [Planomonospora parontospora subsp. antibiotica]GII13984.1 two-component sensor histidine kinase [Planomonospora parontospora subsp. antibiotica]